MKPSGRSACTIGARPEASKQADCGPETALSRDLRVVWREHGYEDAKVASAKPVSSLTWREISRVQPGNRARSQLALLDAN